LRGRVASLLEVGTGFHPELTGRENIFLNGAILGMTRAEIRGKFDEIVAFAEVEKFLDTPVKRYSSGMYVRLAFAVAAHLDPEILIVDEVLAVGDAQFQQKCLGKMQDVAKGGGRTVIFVSHNLAAVRTLCSTGILLERGRVLRTGRCVDVLAAYIARQSADDASGGRALNRRLADDSMLQRLEVEPPVVAARSGVSVSFSIQVTEDETLLEGALLLYNAAGVRIAIVDLRTASGPLPMKRGTTTTFTVSIEALPLVEGDYDLGLYYRSERVSGDFLNLGRLVVLPAAADTSIVPFAAQHRGTVELNSRLSINGKTAGASRGPGS